jgi:transcriptional regulator with XRE-family HTH domain
MSPKRLAAVLKKLRSEMKQEELAKKAKISRGYVAALEAGHKNDPSLAVLNRRAKARGVPMSRLLG